MVTRGHVLVIRKAVDPRALRIRTAAAHGVVCYRRLAISLRRQPILGFGKGNQWERKERERPGCLAAWGSRGGLGEDDESWPALSFARGIFVHSYKN